MRRIYNSLGTDTLLWRAMHINTNADIQSKIIAENRLNGYNSVIEMERTSGYIIRNELTA